MARKHIVNYYIEQQSAYNQMLEDVNDIEKAYKAGEIDYDRYADLRDRLTPSLETEKDKYEFLSYIMFLLDIPNRPKKGKRYYAQNKMYFAYLDKFKSENMINESAHVLKEFKEIVKKEFKDKKVEK